MAGKQRVENGASSRVERAQAEDWLTIETCRKILGYQAAALSDDDIEQLRDHLYQCAWLCLDLHSTAIALDRSAVDSTDEFLKGDHEVLLERAAVPENVATVPRHQSLRVDTRSPAGRLN